MIETMELFPGVRLRCFADPRFKQNCLSVQFLRPMCREEAALNALIPTVLLRGCTGAPDLRKITRKLDDLYGASISPLARQNGDYQSVGFYCSFIADSYCLENDRVLQPLLAFLEELIFSPVLEEGVFCRDFVESEKKNLLSVLETRINDKRSWAVLQMIRNMCKNDPYGLSSLGEPEEVRAVTAQSAYAQYEKLLTESTVEVFYVGGAKPEEVTQMLRPMCARFAKNALPLKPQTAFCDGGEGEYTQQMDVAQARLCLGFTTPITIRTEEFAAMQLCNAVLGSGMTSKLFRNVREKLSLCYDVSSSYRSSKGILVVTAGVEDSKLDTAYEEIIRQVEDCKNGNITPQELEAARKGLITALQGVHDSPGGIEDYYSSISLSCGNLTPEMYLKAVESVTAEDVCRAAQKLRLHTRYVLKGVQ